MNRKFLKDLIDNLKEDKQKQTLNSSILIIDGLNTFLRNFAVINHLNSDGSHIGGLTGALKSIGYAIKLIQPTRVIVVFDGPGGSDSKKNLYPEYKGNRNTGRLTNYSTFTNKEEESESISNQITRLVQYLQCLPIDLICIDAVEADDVMGYLVSKFEKKDEVSKITLMSADQDFLQLVSSKTQVYSPTKKRIYGPKEVLNEYNIHSNNFIMMKILLGDSSDNLPGITGLGPKKLFKLFPELSEDKVINLDDIFEKSEKGEGKLFDQIVERKIQLGINNRLMNLKDINLSPENINIIEEHLIEYKELNEQVFTAMYNKDLLGNSIPYVNHWLSQVFNALHLFRK